MGAEQLQWEFLADEVRSFAGLREDENERSTVIVVRHLGPDGIALEPDLHGSAYLRLRVNGGYQIVIRPDLPDLRFVLMHELSHYAIRKIAKLTLAADVEERAANYTAAAILAPAKAVRRAYAYFGNDLRKLKAIAAVFGLSQTSMQLRLAEVIGDERAIVTANNGNVISRGTGWGTVPAVDVARGRRRSPGVAKATLHGGIDEGRVALRAR